MNEIKRIAGYCLAFIIWSAVCVGAGIYYNEQRAVQQLETERVKREAELNNVKRAAQADREQTDAAAERQRLLIQSLIDGTSRQSERIRSGLETQGNILSVLDVIGTQSVILAQDGTWTWSSNSDRAGSKIYQVLDGGSNGKE